MLTFTLKRIYKRDGFTLIELMVAIAIVAILATIGITLYNSTQTTARDSKRKQDIAAIANALESHLNSTGTQQPCPDDPTNQNGGPYGPNNYCAPLSSWFTENKIPQDPINNASKGYVYTDYYNSVKALPGDGDSTFVLCAQLENAGGNASDTKGTGASGPSATYFCRTNQQ